MTDYPRANPNQPTNVNEAKEKRKKILESVRKNRAMIIKTKTPKGGGVPFLLSENYISALSQICAPNFA